MHFQASIFLSSLLVLASAIPTTPDQSLNSALDKRAAGPIPRKFVGNQCTDIQKRQIENAWKDAKKIALAQTTGKDGFDFNTPHTRWLGKDWNWPGSWIPWKKDFKKILGDNWGRMNMLMNDKATQNAYIYYYCDDWAKICTNDPNAKEYTIAYESSSTGFIWDNHYVTFCPQFFDEKKHPAMGTRLNALRGRPDQQTVADNYWGTQGYILLHELYHANPLVTKPQATDSAYGAQLVKKQAAEEGTDKSYLNADSYALDGMTIYAQQYFNLKSSPDAASNVVAAYAMDAGSMRVKKASGQGPFPNTATPDPKQWIEFDAPAASAAPAPPAQSKTTCKGLTTTKWVPRDPIFAAVEGFCADAEKQGVQDKNSGSISRNFLSGKDQTALSITWPSGSSWKPSKAECMAAMKSVIDDCDGNAGSANPLNWKHGGVNIIGSAKYEVTPLVERGYRHGVCSFHLTETETWTGVDSPGFARHWRFFLNAEIKDGSNAVVGGTNGKSVEAGQNGGNPYVFDKLYAPLAMTPQAQGGDYIQFSIGKTSWTTKDSGGDGGRCNLGAYDSAYSPAKRQMDCFFPC